MADNFRFLLCLMATCCFCSKQVCAAEAPLKVGVLNSPSLAGNLFESNSIKARIVRNLTSGALIKKRAQDGLFDLRLASQFQLNAEGGKWRFLVPKTLRFTNTQLVTPDDLQYSLERCRLAGRLQGVESISVGDLGLSGARDAWWIELNIAPAPLKGAAMDKLISQCSSCPVLEKLSSELFGELLGQGTNLVSTGPFNLTSLKTNGEIELSRSFAAKTMSYPKKLSLPQFDQTEQALTALRFGNIDIMFLQGSGSSSMIADDSTLRGADCDGYLFVARKGVSYDCKQGLDLSEVHYLS